MTRVFTSVTIDDKLYAEKAFTTSLATDLGYYVLIHMPREEVKSLVYSIGGNKPDESREKLLKKLSSD